MLELQHGLNMAVVRLGGLIYSAAFIKTGERCVWVACYLAGQTLCEFSNWFRSFCSHVWKCCRWVIEAADDLRVHTMLLVHWLSHEWHGRSPKTNRGGHSSSKEPIYANCVCRCPVIWGCVIKIKWHGNTDTLKWHEESQIFLRELWLNTLMHQLFLLFVYFISSVDFIILLMATHTDMIKLLQF